MNAPRKTLHTIGDGFRGKHRPELLCSAVRRFGSLSIGSTNAGFILLIDAIMQGLTAEKMIFIIC